MEWYEVRARRVGKPDHCSKSYDDEEDARSLSDRMNKNGHSTVIVKCQVVAVKVAVNAERDGSTVGATCSKEPDS